MLSASWLLRTSTFLASLLPWCPASLQPQKHRPDQWPKPLKQPRATIKRSSNEKVSVRCFVIAMESPASAILILWCRNLFKPFFSLFHCYCINGGEGLASFLNFFKTHFCGDIVYCFVIFLGGGWWESSQCLVSPQLYHPQILLVNLLIHVYMARLIFQEGLSGCSLPLSNLKPFMALQS